MPKGLRGFQPGNPGKAKGAISKQTAFKNFLFSNFTKNQAKATKILDKMYDSQDNFKWVMSLLTNLCPKEIEHSGEGLQGPAPIVVVIPKERQQEYANRLSGIPTG